MGSLRSRGRTRQSRAGEATAGSTHSGISTAQQRHKAGHPAAGSRQQAPTNVQQAAAHSHHHSLNREQIRRHSLCRRLPVRRRRRSRVDQHSQAASRAAVLQRCRHQLQAMPGAHIRRHPVRDSCQWGGVCLCLSLSILCSQAGLRPKVADLQASLLWCRPGGCCCGMQAQQRAGESQLARGVLICR